MGNKKKIDGLDAEGKEVTVYVVTPSPEDRREADVVEKKMFAKLVNEKDDKGNSTAILRSRLFEIATQQNLWDEEKSKLEDELNNTIVENLEKLHKGGIKLTEAREIALEVTECRQKINMLHAPLSDLKRYSVESQCMDAAFEFLFIKCVKDEEGNQIFQTVEEYKDGPDHPWLGEASSYFANKYYGLEENWENELPENKFLIKYKFVDEDLNFINKEGQKINRAGELIEDTEEEKEAEPQPFLDDEGNPVKVDND